MGDIRHATYVGPRADLRGRGALLMPSPSGDGAVQAQFDLNGTDMTEGNDGGPLNYLCFGWHDFPARDFRCDGGTPR
jgi:hypothetical protein